MNSDPFSAFLIAGTNSGSGKTTLTLGILRILSRRGIRVRPFKCGPDFIDPILHRQAAGTDSINLDTWFGTDRSFAKYTEGVRVAAVEGVMGLFDGAAPGNPPASSSAELASTLRLPVILTVDAKGLSDSIAPLVRGFAQWMPERVGIAGVIANRTGSARHAELLRGALERAELPPLIGWLGRDDSLALPERHLGLETGKLGREWLEKLADSLERTLDVDRLLRIGETPRPGTGSDAESGAVRPPAVRKRLGTALDEAFLFYYPENFDLLRGLGIEPVFFSPLADAELPPDLDGLWFGGGYPELYADRLAANSSMLDSIRRFAKTHPVYGECGGYLYLMEGVEGFDGKFRPFLNLLPGRARMNPRPAALGYREMTGEWGTARGHEFHYSSLVAPLPAGNKPLWRAVDRKGRESVCGSISGNVKGSYLHLHFGSSRGVLRAFGREMGIG